MLSETESSRLCVLLEECVERLELLSVVSNRSGDSSTKGYNASSTVRQTTDANMGYLLTQQKSLQEQYSGLANQHNEETRTQRKIHAWSENMRKSDLVYDQMVNTSEILRQCTSSISKIMSKSDPENLKKISEVHAQRNILIELITQTVFELSGSGSYSSLQDKTDYHLEQEEAFQKTTKHLDAIRQQKDELQEKINQDTAVFEERRNDMDAVLKGLTQEFSDSTRDFSIQVKFELEVARAEIHTVQRQRRCEMQRLQKELDELTQTLATENTVAAKTKEYLESSIEKQKQTCADWSTRYSEEFANQTNLLASLTLNCEDIHEQLEQLELRNSEEKRLLQEERVAAQLSLELELANARSKAMNRAATVIQQGWKAGLLRRQSSKAKKKAAKKKGAAAGKGKKKAKK